ncbi:hypothetical protein [Flammeovirga sp. SJP92]|uniref:hypothetical protein n=1 Tax=Flammeovirga sp. SJP92 TaxID=1775430 RepID=UPI000798CC85|nr:hypothetical protein [Flammeovirga sp. SJP92]KXX66672.1 hypothetical protein AVL50_31005 [Flammeovirga sp. SJP92]
MLESEYIYEDGRYSPQKSIALSLTKQLNEKELVVLQSSENLLVRCYAFQQLCLNNSLKVLTVIQNNISNGLKISRIDGCLITEQLLIEYYLESCFTTSNQSIRTKLFHLLYSFGKTDLLTKYTIERIPVNEQNYPLIEKAILEGDNRFLYLFLSYRKGNYDRMIEKAVQKDSMKIATIDLFQFINNDVILKDLSIVFLEQNDRLNQLRREQVFLNLLKLEKFDLVMEYKDLPEYQKPLYIALYMTCTFPELRLELEKKYPSFTKRARQRIDGNYPSELTW